MCLNVFACPTPMTAALAASDDSQPCGLHHGTPLASKGDGHRHERGVDRGGAAPGDDAA